MSLLFNFLQKKIVIKVPVWLFLLPPLVLYAAWEYYWYTKVGLRVIHWHTHLAVYLYLWVTGIFIFLSVRKIHISSQAANYFLLFTTVIFSLAFMEAFLFFFNIKKTYMEKITGYYTSPYEPLDKDYYHVWTPNKPHWITKPEYSFWRPTNSLGLPDEEWPIAKRPKEKRILTLGDSFTEGDGAPFDSSYVSLLKAKLHKAGYNFYVMNAGVCGSDPFDNYINLKNRLLVYQPDIIIQVLSSMDLTTDISLRGGMERFQPNGTLKYEPAPWWEPFYAVSNISRVFFSMAGYDELLRLGSLTPAAEKRLNEKTADLFTRYASLCREKDIRLLVVLRPDKKEIVESSYAFNFSYLLGHFRQQGVEVFDLLPAYEQYISKSKTEPKDYYWVKDGHHNPKGYEMMAQTIFETVPLVAKDSLPQHEK